ncbi:MAG TPA: ATP-binding cassette domain-containing protein, partial [Vicinamibacterales bacterium]|nr:ATP-binding cassette domain-containing protein [Vicinamibacterales bacterium]
TAHPGEVVAIVGPSGSGKSTVADLLLRLLDPDDGVVTIDGRDLRSMRLGDLRRAVALVDQEPCILHATIAENIRYARPEATDGEVIEAARRAALDRFVETLPRKYDTVVGERGHALSVGERQRLAAARAFLTNPAVLVLDEPTSALDAVAERQLAAGYESLMAGRTTIVITHRSELAERADRVVSLEAMSGALLDNLVRA